MSRACLLCGDEESLNTALLVLACGRHYVCLDAETKCLAEIFNNATNNEQTYPAKCCDQILFIDDYEGFIPDLLPFEVYMKYKEKEQEYSVRPRSVDIRIILEDLN
jgi:hypothetical protein